MDAGDVSVQTWLRLGRPHDGVQEMRRRRQHLGPELVGRWRVQVRGRPHGPELRAFGVRVHDADGVARVSPARSAVAATRASALEERGLFGHLGRVPRGRRELG